MVIYKTTNLINGKIYIGQTHNLSDKYIGSGKNLKRAIKKYGKENFTKDVIEYCDSDDQLNEREKYWITYYNSKDKNIGYNLTYGGQTGWYKNCKHSEETKRKIGEGVQNSEKYQTAMKLKSHSENISNALMGHPGYNKGGVRSDETVRKIKDGVAKAREEGRLNNEFSQTPEFKEKCRQNATGSKNPNAKLYRVVMNGEEMEFYTQDSLYEYYKNNSEMIVNNFALFNKKLKKGDIEDCFLIESINYRHKNK